MRKLSAREAAKIADVIELLVAGKTSGLDIKQLKGHRDIFRVRVGKHRIIYKQEFGELVVLHIAGRNEGTYKNVR